MSILQYTARDLLERGEDFTVMLDSTISQIRNGNAMLIYVHLASGAYNHAIHKAEMIRRTGLSPYAYNKGIQYLRGLGLVVRLTMRGDKGYIAGGRSVVRSEPGSDEIVRQKKTP